LVIAFMQLYKVFSDTKNALIFCMSFLAPGQRLAP